MIGNEDVAGSLVIAAVRNVAWRRHVAARREEAAAAVVAHKARGWRSRGGCLATAWCVEAQRRRRLGYAAVAMVRECQAVSV